MKIGANRDHNQQLLIQKFRSLKKAVKTACSHCSESNSMVTSAFVWTYGTKINMHDF
jgi:hypothetical protein